MIELKSKPVMIDNGQHMCMWVIYEDGTPLLNQGLFTESEAISFLETYNHSGSLKREAVYLRSYLMKRKNSK